MIQRPKLELIIGLGSIQQTKELVQLLPPKIILGRRSLIQTSKSWKGFVKMLMVARSSLELLEALRTQNPLIE